MRVTGINGTKVECKGSMRSHQAIVFPCINGTKVECKVVSFSSLLITRSVLMEPKWNVKGIEKL